MWSQPYAVRAESYVSQTWDCGKRPTLAAPSQEGKWKDNGAPEPDSNQFTQTLPASQGLELWNFPKNWKEDQILQLDLERYSIWETPWIIERQKTCAWRKNSEACFANCGPAKWEGNWLQNSDRDMHAT